MATLADFWRLDPATSANDPRLQEILAALRQYDPNARVYESQTGGGVDPGMGTSQYTPEFDMSKLPENVIGKRGFEGLMWAPAEGGKYDNNAYLKDPKLVYDDPVYGRVTTADNYVSPPSRSWVDIVGPLAVGGAALWGSGLLSGAGSIFGGAEGAGASGESILGGFGPGSGMGVGGAEIATPGIEAYFPGGSMAGLANQGGKFAGASFDLLPEQFGPEILPQLEQTPYLDAMAKAGGYGTGLLGKAGDALSNAGKVSDLLQRSGLLGDPSGTPIIGGGGGGGSRGFGAPSMVNPYAETEAEALAALRRKQGLAHYLNFGQG